VKGSTQRHTSSRTGRSSRGRRGRWFPRSSGSGAVEAPWSSWRESPFAAGSAVVPGGVSGGSDSPWGPVGGSFAGGQRRGFSEPSRHLHALVTHGMKLKTCVFGSLRRAVRGG
jgi:hypothetical protein